MSSRGLRRLQGKDEVEKLIENMQDDESGDEHSISLIPSPGRNKFSFVLPSSDEEQLTDDEDEQKEEEEVNISEEESKSNVEEEMSLPNAPKSQRKVVSKEKSDGLIDKEKKMEQDLEELIKELDLEKTTDPLSSSTSSLIREEVDNSGIFTINLDNLDPAVELKRKVGGAGVGNINDSLLPDYNNGLATKRGLTSHNKGRLRRSRKQLIAPRPTWTKVTSALVELRLTRLKNDDIYGSDVSFVFVPTAEYTAQFDEFIELVELGDIELIYAFVRKYPLHVDALLVVGDFLRMNSSSSDAMELIERAVYILEKCTLSTNESGVDLTAGRMRFPYNNFENRRLHLAFIRHCQFLVKNGCHSTALEYSKILWSFDPLTDPTGVRIIADFSALQSGNYEWINEVFHQHVVTEAAWLANWYFSRSLSLFLQERGKSTEGDNALQEAISIFPWMIPRLATAIGIKLNEDSWNETFKIKSYSRNDYLGSFREAMSKIYAQRTGILWKQYNGAREWLEENINIVLSMTNQESIIQEINPSLHECASILRHSLISDLPSVQVSLPPSISPNTTQPYDPLPPELLLDYIDPSQSKCSIQ